MPRRQTTIRLTESLVDELDREADEQGITRSEHIRQILSERHETTVNAQRLERLRTDYIGMRTVSRMSRAVCATRNTNNPKRHNRCLTELSSGSSESVLRQSGIQIDGTTNLSLNPLLSAASFVRKQVNESNQVECWSWKSSLELIVTQSSRGCVSLADGAESRYRCVLSTALICVRSADGDNSRHLLCPLSSSLSTRCRRFGQGK